MKIETKFNKDDEVWFKYTPFMVSYLYTGKVYCIDVLIDRTAHIEYSIKVLGRDKHVSVMESDLFSTESAARDNIKLKEASR